MSPDSGQETFILKGVLTLPVQLDKLLKRVYSIDRKEETMDIEERLASLLPIVEEGIRPLVETLVRNNHCLLLRGSPRKRRW